VYFTIKLKESPQVKKIKNAECRWRYQKAEKQLWRPGANIINYKVFTVI
jgi:hypothetical protein